MKFFHFIPNEGLSKALVADGYDFGDVDAEALTEGRHVSEWYESASVSVGPLGRDGTPDDVLQSASPAPIFSPRLKGSLEEAGVSGIQYLPVTLLTSNGHAVGSFWVANIVQVMPALDLSASSFRRYPDDYFLESRRGQIAAVRRPVLQADKLGPDVDILRLAEFPAYVFVSQRFREAYEGARCSGAEFSPVHQTASPAEYPRKGPHRVDSG